MSTSAVGTGARPWTRLRLEKVLDQPVDSNMYESKHTTMANWIQ